MITGIIEECFFPGRCHKREKLHLKFVINIPVKEEVLQRAAIACVSRISSFLKIVVAHRWGTMSMFLVTSYSWFLLPVCSCSSFKYYIYAFDVVVSIPLLQRYFTRKNMDEIDLMVSRKRREREVAPVVP